MSARACAGAMLILVAWASPAAAEEWATTLSGPTIDRLTHVAPLADGGAIASGTIWSWGAGLRDAGLVRLDPGGAVAWQVAVGTPADEIAPAVAVDEAGATCLTIGRAGVARLAPDGTLSWARRLSAGVDEAVPTRAGGCVAAGDDGAGTVFVASLSATGDVAWSRRLTVPPPCDLAASSEPVLSGLGVLADGRVVVGLVSPSDGPDVACTALAVEVLDAAGTTLQQAFLDARDGSGSGRVRVDPGGTVVSSVVLAGPPCTRRLVTRVQDLDGSWGLEFEGIDDACGTGTSDGVAGAQAWGRRVATIGWRSGRPSVQEHDEAGLQLWSREAFDARLLGDGTFVGIAVTEDGGRVERRGREGLLERACVRSPAESDARFSARDARWPADVTPDAARAEMGIAATPLAVTVTPARFESFPACGRCASSPDPTDADGDGVADACDLCPGVSDPEQDDRDGDGTGAACDDCTDVDGDGLGEPGLPGTCAIDTCPNDWDPTNADLDADGEGDACERPGAEPSALDVRPAATPLVVRKAAPGLALQWEDVGARSYALRRGTIAALRAGGYDDVPLLCGLPAPLATLDDAPGSAYFLAVSRDLGPESSLGRDSFGAERPAGAPCP